MARHGRGWLAWLHVRKAQVKKKRSNEERPTASAASSRGRQVSKLLALVDSGALESGESPATEGSFLVTIFGAAPPASLKASARSRALAAFVRAQEEEEQAAAAQKIAAANQQAVNQLRSRFKAAGLWSAWSPGVEASALMSLPDDLWTRMCPAGRTILLGATSKRVRALLAQLQSRVAAEVWVKPFRVLSDIRMDQSLPIHHRISPRQLSWRGPIPSPIPSSAGTPPLILLDIYRGMPRLQSWCVITTLSFAGCVLGVVGASELATVLRQCPDLTCLNLRGCKIRELGATWLAEVLPECEALARLDLGENDIQNRGMRRIAVALKQASALTHLNLESNEISAHGIRKLTGRLHSTLTHLNLCGNPIDGAGTYRLAEALEQCPALAYLNLENTELTLLGVDIVARELERYSVLAHLNLSNLGVHFGPQGALMLAAGLEQSPSLVHLDLSYCSLGLNGSALLAEGLVQCPALSHLNLAGNDVGDGGATALAEMLVQCSALTHLALGANRIGDYGGQKLAGVLGQCVALSHLDLRSNFIGHRGTARLRACWRRRVTRKARSLLLHGQQCVMVVLEREEWGDDESDEDSDQGAEESDGSESASVSSEGVE